MELFSERFFSANFHKILQMCHAQCTITVYAFRRLTVRLPWGSASISRTLYPGIFLMTHLTDVQEGYTFSFLSIFITVIDNGFEYLVELNFVNVDLWLCLWLWLLNGGSHHSLSWNNDQLEESFEFVSFDQVLLDKCCGSYKYWFFCSICLNHTLQFDTNINYSNNDEALYEKQIQILPYCLYRLHHHPLWSPLSKWIREKFMSSFKFPLHQM